MIEVDFLPEWYRLRRRRQQHMQRQWIALGLVFLIMVSWNSFAARNISMASAEISLGETHRIRAEHMSEKYQRLRSRLGGLQKKMDVSSLLDVRLNVADTITMLSEVIPEDAVLQKLQFKAVKFSDVHGRVNPSRFNSESAKSDRMPLVLEGGDVHFRVALCADVADTETIAGFLSDLEKSPNFQQVHLRYLRSKSDPVEAPKGEINADDRTPSSGQNARTGTNEFEIYCYINQCDMAEEKRVNR